MREVKHKVSDYNLAHKWFLSSVGIKLYKAVIDNDEEKINSVLTEDVDRYDDLVNENLGGGTHYVGFRAIHWVAANGNLRAIRALKAHNVDLTQRTGAGWLKYFAGPQKFELPLETAV